MAEEKKSRVASVMGGSSQPKKKKKSKAKKSKKPVHKMHIRHSANGGFIAEHESAPAGEGELPTPNEEHTLPDMAALQAHVGEHMQQPDEEEAQGPETPPSPAAQPGV
jgi:hypothetical protein